MSLIDLQFGGWFQCGLATDPDPYDEPRGISGYMRSLPGEPDFDRVIYFNTPPFERPYGPGVGVRVKQATATNPAYAAFAANLMNAQVDLLDKAKFEGRNGVVAEDGKEPIYPFKLGLTTTFGSAAKPFQDAPVDFPYYSLQANGVGLNTEENIRKTGIPDIRQHLLARLSMLRRVLGSATDEVTRLTLQQRIRFLQSLEQQPNTIATQFFPYMMAWDITLTGTTALDGTMSAEMAQLLSLPWQGTFWMGAWDPDTLCGYVAGTIKIG